METDQNRNAHEPNQIHNGQEGRRDHNANKEEWLKLCEQAAAEQDPDKLVILTREICRLLDERTKTLKRVSS